MPPREPYQGHSCCWVSSIFGTDCWNTQKKKTTMITCNRKNHFWLVVSTHLTKNRQIGSLPPKERWTLRKNWNHHLQVVRFQYHPHIPPSFSTSPMVVSPTPSLNWKWYATSTGKVSDLGSSLLALRPFWRGERFLDVPLEVRIKGVISPTYRVGGWTNPIEKIFVKFGNLPQLEVHIKHMKINTYLKQQPSYEWGIGRL